MLLSVLLAAILDFLRVGWPGLRTWNSSKQKCYFQHESQVCMSAVHPDMMYNHDNWDFICYFGGHFVLQFWKGKTKNRAWHGTDLESAYPNCVKTTAWQILLRNALQTLTMPLFEKWALTIYSYHDYTVKYVPGKIYYICHGICKLQLYKWQCSHFHWSTMTDCKK